MYSYSVAKNRALSPGRVRLSLISLLYLLLISIPFDIFSIWSFGNRGIKPIWFTGFLLVIAFFFHVFSDEQKIKKNTVGNFILVFNVIALLSSLFNLIDDSRSQLIDFLTLWFRLPLFTLVFFVVTSLNLTDVQLKNVLKLWIGMAFVLSIYGIYQVFARYLKLPFAYLRILNPSISGGEFIRGGTFGSYIRPSSVFAEPSFFGSYLLSPLLLTGVLWLRRKQVGDFFYRSKVVNSIVFLTIIAAFLLTFSMGAYAGLMFAILIALFNKRLSRKFFHFILILFVILLIIGFMLEPLFGVNFAEIVFIRTQAHILSLLNPLEGSGLESPYAKTSMANRYIRVKAAFEVWLNHPLIGVGINNFYYYYPTDVPARVHSGFTQSLAEMGLLGFIGLILIFGSTLINIRKYIHEMKEESPSSVILTAFYYIIWAEVFMVLVGEAWIKEEVWVNLSMAVLVFYRSERKMVKAGSYYRF